MRPSWIEVDLAAVRHNVTAISAAVKPAAYCAVVKADAYGHGDVPVAEAALDAGAACLAVALAEEGVRLREAGLSAPVIVLSEPEPAEAKEMLVWGLIPTVYREEFATAVEEAAGPDPVDVHVKIDTGMHRVGADPDTAVMLARRVADSPRLRLGGLWTHFPVADEDLEFTASQVDAFDGLVRLLGEEGTSAETLHLANTAGALAIPAARKDMVRIGLGTYGLRPAPDIGANIELRPAMAVLSRVSMVRTLPRGARPSYGRCRALAEPAAVATVPIGYADGLARRLSATGGEVLIRGRRYPFAGTVTMDHIVVDCGSDPVAVGDEVVVLGSQGEESVTAEEWAQRLGTVNYEILCRFGPRMPRRYLP
ncbi:MAG: alanine racemase [Acidimicrobiia bacterium]